MRDAQPSEPEALAKDAANFAYASGSDFGFLPNGVFREVLAMRSPLGLAHADQHQEPAARLAQRHRDQPVQTNPPWPRHDGWDAAAIRLQQAFVLTEVVAIDILQL